MRKADNDSNFLASAFILYVLYIRSASRIPCKKPTLHNYSIHKQKHAIFQASRRQPQRTSHKIASSLPLCTILCTKLVFPIPAHFQFVSLHVRLSFSSNRCCIQGHFPLRHKFKTIVCTRGAVLKYAFDIV